MSEPFLAEIRIMGFNFAPRGWAFCDGQILPISQHQSLYSLLGTIYGGDGRTSFALPDLRGRTPIHVGNSNGGSPHQLGEKSGEETHILEAAEMPQHTHSIGHSSQSADNSTPTNTIPAQPDTSTLMYKPSGASSSERQRAGSTTIGSAGEGAAHNNMQPYLAVHFCIALTGLFPSRN